MVDEFEDQRLENQRVLKFRLRLVILVLCCQQRKVVCEEKKRYDVVGAVRSDDGVR